MAIPMDKSYGVGIGLRRENSAEVLQQKPSEIRCLEIAPENYLNSGGKQFREFQALAEIYPILFHGISLSVGSLKPLKKDFLKDLKIFLDKFKAPWMSDHLCYSSVLGAQFHDLLPLPMTREAVNHVVPRIRYLQDYFERPFAIENISSYLRAGEPEMEEWEFISQVVEQADCSLLLDVNNVYVNSVNFGFDPFEYLKNLPLERTLHIHVAGHKDMDGYLLDNHGAPIIDPVWDLLKYVLKRVDVPAIIIERDHNIPPLSESILEVEHAQAVVRQAVSERSIRPSKLASGGAG